MIKKNFILFILIVLNSCSPGFLIDKNKSDSYFKSYKGELIYCFDGNYLAFPTVKCYADKKSFKVLSRHIAIDNQNIFYKGEKQKQIDYSSFYIDKNVPKDKNYPYTQSDSLEPIEGVDAKTFEYLPIDSLNYSLSKDKNNYYLNLKKLDVDYKTFTFINNSFAKDKDSIYAFYYSYKLFSFKENNSILKPVNNEYIRDGNNIYFVNSLGENTLRKVSFSKIYRTRVINDFAICVNTKVIINGKIFKYKDVDANTFKMYGSNFYYSKDKNHVYYEQELIPKANPQTFTPLNFGFGKDSKFVFHQKKILEGVDAASFKHLSTGIFGDELGNIYTWEGKMTSKAEEKTVN